MYVCASARTHVPTCLRVRACTCVPALSACGADSCVRANACVCMCACVHVCMCAYVHMCMCACVHVCMCACVCVRARVFVRAHARMFVRIWRLHALTGPLMLTRQQISVDVQCDPAVEPRRAALFENGSDRHPHPRCRREGPAWAHLQPSGRQLARSTVCVRAPPPRARGHRPYPR